MDRALGRAVARPRLALLAAGGLLLVVLAPAAVIVPLVTRPTASDVTDGTGVTPPPPAAIVAPAALKTASSALTISGKGVFSGLRVTVGQTRDLINQTVPVTWAGGKPTNDTAAFDVNYLQIMQCWGDASSGPERTQCEFGGNVAFDTRGGQRAASRQLNTSTYKDPKDPLLTRAAPTADVFVPFASVTGTVVTGAGTLKNPFYDNTTTNELPFGRTRGDGRGATLFEMLTYREAPGLGCGQVLTAGAKKGQPRGCWLVIVPRGETETDGSDRATVLNSGSHRLDTSPLSTSNWANRLVVPLSFLPVGNACPISAAQEQTTGVESATEAVLRWQPALCRNKGPVFGFAQSPDATAGRTLATDTPGMVFVNGPAPAPPSDRLYTYAPIALSGLAIGVTLDRQSPATAKPADRTHDGEPIAAVNLTPRLVAKLLTQSYRFGAPGNGSATYLQKNVDNLTLDPDFLAINPAFKGTAFGAGVDLITPIGLAGSTTLLWQWIAEDQDAADFVAGLPDPWGMRVNPFYQGVSLPRPDFPKVDPYCAEAQKDAPLLCTLDEHPYSQDLHDAARSASRGDSLSRNFWDANANPPVWKKRELQLNGRRQLLAATDTATAARYGLVVARLRNAAGRFVAPTTASLVAAAKVMRPTGVAGVLAPDPTTTSATAYPLPLLTYAATAPNILTSADARAYASFVRYAVGAGQVPGASSGTLPAGYAPLPSTLRTAALTAAKVILARKGPRVASSGGGGGGGGSGGGGSGGGGGNGGSTRGGSGSGGGTRTPTAATPSTGTTAPQNSPNPQNSQNAANPTSTALTNTNATRATPDEPTGRERYALVVALALGVTAALFGPSLPRLARRLRL